MAMVTVTVRNDSNDSKTHRDGGDDDDDEEEKQQ